MYFGFNGETSWLLMNVTTFNDLCLLVEAIYEEIQFKTKKLNEFFDEPSWPKKQMTDMGVVTVLTQGKASSRIKKKIEFCRIVLKGGQLCQ